MTKFRLLAILLASLTTTATAAVTTSASAPTTNIIASSSAGAIDTALFDEDANANHARGQLFGLADGSGTAYEITAITVKKSTTQTYANDTLTLRVFEGTEAQWDSGTGHSTATDGSDYYVDTTVTPLHAEAFTLNGAFTDNHYVTFELATPLTVNEDSDFGFLMTYDQSGGTQDRFRHREGGSGGRLSITTTAHGVSSRNVVYFVQGTAIAGGGPTVVADSTAPGAGPVSHTTFGSYTTTFGTSSANPYFGCGQTVTCADTGDGNTQWSVTELAVRSKAARSFGTGDKIRLSVFGWLPSNDALSMGNWITGDGLSDGDLLDGTTVGAVLVDGVDYTLPASIADGDYLHFGFNLPLELDENAAYGVFFEFIDADGGTGDTDIRLGVGAAGSTYPDGTQLRTTSTANSSFDQDLTLFVAGTAIPGPPAVDLVLGSPFQNRMVLQRDKPVNIWGQALPSTAVSVTIDGNNAMGTSDATGAWKIQLPALTSGGPYSLEVTSNGESITLTDVLVGDVWFCFGQSNMVRPLSEMTGSSSYITAIAGNDNIRCLKIDQDASLTEEESVGMSWLANSSAGTWTSVGAVFAHQLNAATNVPVAIIWAGWGSSSIEGWMPLELAGQFPHFDEMLELYQSIGEYRSGQTTSSRLPADYSTNEEGLAGLAANGWSSTDDDIFMRTRPNIIYNKRVHPMRCYGISGFIWYQGEANAGAPDYSQYGFTLPKFVTEYRERFDQGDLPFLGVQLPSYNGTYWPWFRESQDQLRTVNNGHVAVTIDTGLSGNIHPPDKEPIGIRLSLLARKYALGEAIVADSPRFASMSVGGNQATITFTNAAGLSASGTPATFELAGSDQVFHAATSATISGSDVIISSTSEPAPVAVRYAWSPAPVNQVNLVNSAGLPAAPFRTDSWALPGLGAQAPMSVDESYEVAMNTTLNVAASGVLENDIDLNHDPLSATLVSDVTDGTLSLLPDGSFAYTPHSGFAGTDSFTYYCSDSGLQSSNAIVTITVTGAQTGYYTWRSGIAWNPGDDETETGDSDQDTIVNFLEFAFGLDPLQSDVSGLPTLTPGGSDAAYDFNNVQPGVTYEVLLSTDLVTWSDPPFEVLTSASTTPVIIPSSEAVDGNLFVRLRVTE